MKTETYFSLVILTMIHINHPYINGTMLRPDTGLKNFFFQKGIIYRYYYIKRLVVTSLEDITLKKNIFFMVAILNNKMASTDRDYSPFYNSVFSVMAEDRSSIIFVSCTITSIECKCHEIILKIDFQIIIKK